MGKLDMKLNAMRTPQSFMCTNVLPATFFSPKRPTRLMRRLPGPSVSMYRCWTKVSSPGSSPPSGTRSGPARSASRNGGVMRTRSPMRASGLRHRQAWQARGGRA